MAADTFLRAVRALDNLPRFWSGPPTFEKPTALSPEQKAQIGKMYDAGAPQADIARDLRIAPSTVYNHVRRHMRGKKD
jgi:DNA-binding NarL/FixJ family response regulator|tara:strand:- start:859 stop:1092 length:234 start_codon:yes stop_codon:yes gene_type:complete